MCKEYFYRNFELYIQSYFFRGIVKIAEVVSRFKDLSLEDFIQIMVKCGFQLKWKDTSSDYFYLMDFKKVKEMKFKVSDFSLKPCLYKKR